ncbi:hypothetical protein Kpol_246p3 [Vanderwaltozyma polyspora DSM 70294]|uniref:Cytochrome c oxidase subunit n=1 Tax=Vanderwaltozyma polyspora (strain ATCC 22028 / DSM 70294 / BCRC 21397 / CBS 2163 / NBRC 10782 / NRRL Y-8283 / UCD 57-17) TaxID=436907 RepID=A7TT72_VANPO|nr:uncharacterized protein Kpol_246p3 [Vanderwaltozyma polyspora DSM 70294]EDO14534.1 hypothetical protein Kpol_246p3 [Vanderwaltozyma polyspora DSM 70294]
MFRQAAKRSYATLPPHALKPAFGAPNKAAAEAFKKSVEVTTEHAEATSNFWKRISLFVAAPAIGLTAINTYFVEKEHANHREHLKHIPDSEWPKQYEFQNIRSKPYFWGDGDKTLFWNPVVNRHITDE